MTMLPRNRWAFGFPFPPTFSLPVWLTGLCAVVVLLAALTPLIRPGRRWPIVAAYVYGGVHLANAIGHMTVSVTGQWLAPGVLSSPILLIAAGWLLYETSRVQRHRQHASGEGEMCRWMVWQRPGCRAVFKRWVALSLLAFGSGCASAQSQAGHPDLSGTWVLNRLKSHLEVPSPDSTIFVVRHDEPTVRIFRTHATDGTLDTVTITLRTDSSQADWNLRGMKVTSRSWWEGDELIFWSALAQGERRASQVVRYSLSKDRQTFTALETVDAGEASHTNRWVFDRRQ